MIGYCAHPVLVQRDHLVGRARLLAGLLELVALSSRRSTARWRRRRARCRRPCPACSRPARSPRARRRPPRGSTTGSARIRLRRRRRSSSPSSSGSPAACGRSRRRCAAPRRTSWRADRHDHELLEVDAAVGVRAAVQDVHHRHRQAQRAVAAEQRRDVRVERHVAAAAAAARASAIETPSIAFAPRRPLFGVPSSSIMKRSTARWSASRPTSAARDLAVDVGDRLR